MTYAIVVVAVLILDQAVKYWTNLTLALGETRAFIPGFIELLYTHNYGAAFGLFSDSAAARWIFVALMLVFCFAVVHVLSNEIVEARLGRWSLVLILAGGFGNAIDRAVNGYVIDMFHFTFKIFGKDFPVFNIADIFLTVCGIIFCVWLVFHKPEEQPETRRYPKTARTEREKRMAEQGTDYITQLKKPVAKAKAELDVPPPPVRRAKTEAPKAPVDYGDPFAEFFGNPVTEKKPETPFAPTRTPVPAPAPRTPDVGRDAPGAPSPAPEPQPAPQPAPAPKKDTDFTLEDILAEFK